MRAADKSGVVIPRFCYHPRLSIVGNCRICLVEVEGQPKLAASCSLPVEEGMVVHVNSPKAIEGRRGVIEFLLANHPLDCPVCDKSGECPLQDNSMEHGVMKSRFPGPKLHKPKAVDIGRHVILDAERCILCSRCVRFLAEVTRTGELGIFGRGDTEEIGLAPGKRLDNPYSGCVSDICPVGALTLKEFRFQSRVWYLERADSVCPFCARGCSITVEWNPNAVNKVGDRRVYRFMPRDNPHVNGAWMCDEGRFRFGLVDGERATRVLLREGGKERAAGWDQALDRLWELLRRSRPGRAAVLLSRSSSVEDLFNARELLRRLRGVKVAADAPTGRLPTGDRLLRVADKHANSEGARALGFPAGEGGWARVISRAAAGKLDVLVVAGMELARLHPGAVPAMRRVRHLAMLATHSGPTADLAEILLPIAVFAERDGVFVNHRRRAQRFCAAFPPAGEARPEWQVWRDLLARAGAPPLQRDAAEVFRSLAARTAAFRGLSHAALGPYGKPLRGRGSR